MEVISPSPPQDETKTRELTLAAVKDAHTAICDSFICRVASARASSKTNKPHNPRKKGKSRIAPQVMDIPQTSDMIPVDNCLPQSIANSCSLRFFLVDFTAQL